MVEQKDEIGAKCIEKVPGQPKIKVGTVYHVYRERTGPRSVTCRIQLSGGDCKMNSTNFNKYFDQVE